MPPHGETATVVLATSRSCSAMLIPAQSVSTISATEPNSARTAAATRRTFAIARRPFFATMVMVWEEGGAVGGDARDARGGDGGDGASAGCV